MEGVAFGLRDSVELIRTMTPLEEIRASGGGSASALWLQIIADVIGAPVRVANTPEGAAYGAAVLAATGDGAFASVDEACGAAVRLGRPIDPGENVAVYQNAYRSYRDLYPALQPLFGRLTDLDG